MDVVVALEDSPSGVRIESGELIECGLNPLDVKIQFNVICIKSY